MARAARSIEYPPRRSGRECCPEPGQRSSTPGRPGWSSPGTGYARSSGPERRDHRPVARRPGSRVWPRELSGRAPRAPGDRPSMPPGQRAGSRRMQHANRTLPARRHLLTVPWPQLAHRCRLTCPPPDAMPRSSDPRQNTPSTARNTLRLPRRSAVLPATTRSESSTML